MSTSGRGVWNKKTMVNEARSMDILDLQRKEGFNKNQGLLWTSSWARNGEMVASISYRIEPGENGPTGLRFMYAITDNETGEKGTITTPSRLCLPLVTMAARGGGLSVPWF